MDEQGKGRNKKIVEKKPEDKREINSFQKRVTTDVKQGSRNKKSA